MHKTQWFCILCIGMLSSGFSQTKKDSVTVEKLDEVVITDSRFNLKRENSGKVITKITSKDLEKLKGQSVAEIIGRTAGVEVNGVRSNAGQNLSYFVRGGRNRQVLVMIDGIQVTDASQIANDYDLRLLNADQVESIEILKGASSTLYGTGAATAVINITLKKSESDPVSLSVQSSLGTNQSESESDYNIEDFRNSVALNGTLGKFQYLASFGHQFTDGLSAIAEGTESDAFNSYNGNLKLGYSFSDSFKLDTYGSFDKFKAAFDDSFNFADADNLSVSNQYRIGISPKFKYNNGSFTVNAAFSTIDREIHSDFPSQFNADNIVIDAFNRYTFNEKFYTVLGVNHQDNTMESFSIPFGEDDFSQDIDPETANFKITDPYVNLVYVSDMGLNINAGARLNNHSEYGSHLVYSFNPSYKFDTGFGYVKGLASYSTAFITPSLYQLFEPNFGNPELQPEENATLEIGAEVSITDKALLSLVYFSRNEQQFIDFVDTGGFVFQYQNIDTEFTASGLEFVGRFQFLNTLSLSTNFTYTKVEEELNLRIPELKANARLDYQLCEDTLLSLSYQYNDERNDAYFDSTTFESRDVTLESYSLLDLYFSQKFMDSKLTVFATVSNILNAEYQELFGFATRGRNVSLGFNLKL
ncbi:TonB-dependent receptor plug domain-containing protein [Winogradskyella sp. A3E31]|uniref:TonB-dependent receptor plug domain-containing protein n=1 Tax=Winogradskyella sp. A3E31 TaxID=3349637 RepID=UPI00398B3A2C